MLPPLRKTPPTPQAQKTRSPALQTYPIVLKIRLPPVPADVYPKHIYTLSAKLADVIHHLAWEMFGAEVPTVLLQEFRDHEYVEIRVLLDFPRYFNAVESPFVKRILKEAAKFSPELDEAGREKRWQAAFPSQGQCAGHFRLEFWDRFLMEKVRPDNRYSLSGDDGEEE
jgi:glycine/D-amino acid oxidase-like deaminating enzyme